MIRKTNPFSKDYFWGKSKNDVAQFYFRNHWKHSVNQAQ